MSPAMLDARRPYVRRRARLNPPMPTLWQKAGLLVGYLDQADPKLIAERALAHGFSWVAPKIHDGTKMEEGVFSWVARLREAAPQLLVGGWGVQQYEPEAEARGAAWLIENLKLSFYIADAEGPYKADYRMADGTMGVKERAGRFVSVFREAQPTIPAAFSTFGAGTRKGDGSYYLLGSTTDPLAGPMDFGPWYRGGFRFLPQAYPNEFGDVYSIRNCVAHAQQARWPLSLVHPMLGCYPSAHPYSPGGYVEDLRQAATVGFSVFLAETMQTEDWHTLGRAIGQSGVARR